MESSFLKAASVQMQNSDMTTRSQFQQVEGVHLDAVNSRDVSERLGETLILVVDNQGTELLYAPPVPQLSLASSHSTGGVHLGNIGPGLVSSEEDDSLLGLLESLDLVADN